MTDKMPLLSLTVLDGSSNAGKIKLWLQSGISAGQAMLEGDAIRSPLSALSGAILARQSVTYRSIIDNPSAADSGTMVGYYTVLIFSTTNPDEYSMVTIPAIKPEYVLADGPNSGLVLDTLNPAVISLVDNITSGIWCNPFGFGLVELVGTIVERRRI